MGACNLVFYNYLRLSAANLALIYLFIHIFTSKILYTLGRVSNINEKKSEGIMFYTNPERDIENSLHDVLCTEIVEGRRYTL